MDHIKRSLFTAALAGVIAFAPAVYAADQLPVMTVYAHGHSSGHHSSTTTNYYYCNGHEAHTHNNGVCPYASSGTHYYYCSGHEAHTHKNGVCPYANSGVSKSTIKKVQKKLNQCGYNCGTADGIAGSKTVKALKKFQKDNGLTADGIIGKKTLKALGLA